MGNDSYIRALQYAIGLGAGDLDHSGPRGDLASLCRRRSDAAFGSPARRETADVTVVVSSGDSGVASPLARNLDLHPDQAGEGPGFGTVSRRQSGELSLQVHHTNEVDIGENGLEHAGTWRAEDLTRGSTRHRVVASAVSLNALTHQDGLSGIGVGRGEPDVAADAAPDTGLAVVSTNGKSYGIFPGAGTSAGAPFWAGLMAIADQFAGHQLGFVNAGIYRVARSPQYGHAFHDVTSGSNTVVFPQGTIVGYEASPGWDPVTGWGSPNAAALIPLLVKNVRDGDGAGL